MRVGRYISDEGPALAIGIEDQWINLTCAFEDYERERGQLNPAPLDTVQRLLGLDGCNESFQKRMVAFCNHSGRLPAYLTDTEPDWLIPVQPGKVVAVGRNYRAHAEELGNAVPDSPILFVKTPNTIVRPGAPIEIDPAWGQIDHEGEIGVLIGKRTSRVSAREAAECVAGYTLLNDVTARTMQNEAKKKGLPWFCAKNLDTFCPLGPVITSSDSVSSPLEFDLEVSVNGVLRQTGNTRDFLFPLAELIAYISEYITLEPGDIIATGTPAGVGPLRPGDTVSVSCAELGTLTNPVTDKTKQLSSSDGQHILR